LRLVLVGAGHAHLHLLARAEDLRAAGYEVVLIAPQRFDYSGLATGVLSGAVDEAQASIDIAELAARQSVRHLAARVLDGDLKARRLELDSGETVGFDHLSLNVGSVVDDPQDLGRAPDVWPVKPLTRLFELKARVEARLAGEGPAPVIVVAGGGQTGFEVAAALAGLCERAGRAPDITLIARAAPRWGPPKAIAALEASLARRGVRIRRGEVIGRDAGLCRLSNGADLPCEMLVLAGGLRAPQLGSRLGLATDEKDRIRVGPGLQAKDHPQVSAAGDCAVLDHAPRPMVGVFGVRAAPVLLNNLLASAGCAAPRAYRPQRRWLSIMDLGDGTGLALRGPFWWRGRAALALKRRIDLGFVDRARSP